MWLARLPRPRPRPLRRALSARGNKGPPRPYDESYRGNAVRWTERQRLHVAAAWVYFGAFFGLGSVLVVYNFVTGAPRRIYEIYDHTVNPREPDATEVRNPLYRDVGFGDDQLRGDRARAVLQQILSADKLDEQLGVITAENLRGLNGILTKGVDFSQKCLFLKIS